MAGEAGGSLKAARGGPITGGTPLMLVGFLVSTALAVSPADAWPAFRGTGDSVSSARELPLTWSADAGVAWKADIDGYGQSSPVVWRSRVFVTSTDGPNKERSLVGAYELSSGRRLWQKEFKSALTVAVSDYVSRGAPTPAVDADRVYALFETGNLVALTHDGEAVWQRTLSDEFGKFAGNHGLGSSIALTSTAVIVLVDHDGPSYLLAVEKGTGKTLWKIDRPQNVSWTSPIVSGDRIIVSSSGRCEELDAATGKTIWTFDGLKGNTVPSASVTDSLVIVGSSDTGSNVAIRRGGEGNVTETHRLWKSGEASATFSSPLVYQGHVYLVNRSGVAFCLDEQTGKTVWTQRVGGACWASPLGTCGRIYFFEKSGTTTVVAAGPELKVLATNTLPADDRVYGVAAVEGRFVLRTGSRLICLADAAPGDAKPAEPKEVSKTESKWPDLPHAMTAFGAAVSGDSVYVYGGHHGSPHHYADEGQSGDLLRLSLKDPARWEVVSTGPRLQGLAVVAHNGKLYRVGGFEARNSKDEKQNLWSLPEAARFEPETKSWQPLPAMPAGRSSFDAAVIGDTLYVVGGWLMQGDKDAAWHDTALSLDLKDDKAVWREIPEPGFQRRALSVAAFDGRLYAIGGMQPDGKVTRRTAVFDPKGRSWSQGPELPGEDMEGFGTASYAVGNRLYVSTSSGKLLRLSSDGRSWETVKSLPNARFFHRMLPLGDDRLLLLGGASMQRGKYASVEDVSVPK